MRLLVNLRNLSEISRSAMGISPVEGSFIQIAAKMAL